MLVDKDAEKSVVFNHLISDFLRYGNRKILSIPQHFTSVS